MRVDQHREELAPEQTLENFDVHKEVRPRSDPSAAIGRDATAWHDHMDMGMVRQRRAPGVQHRGDADVGAEVLGIGRDLECGLGRGFEQQVVDHRLVLIGDVGDWCRQCVHHMEIPYRQQIGLAFGEPLAGSGTLTLGTVPIPAAVVGDDGVSAGLVLAAPDMAAEGCRAAALDCRHHLQLVETDVAGIGSAPRRPVIAEDIRDLQRWTGHDRRSLRRRLVLSALPGPLARLRQQVERALDAGDHAGGDARVARGRIQFIVAQQRLDDSDIGAALKQMGSKGVAQRMQRHALLDPGASGRLVEQATQLTGGHRRAGLTARKQPTVLKGRCGIETAAHLPPLPQQIERLRRQHDIAILAALGLLDANDLLRGVDMLDLQPDHLAATQTTAIAETEQHAGLQARGDGQQPPRLVRAHHLRDLLRLAEVIDLGGKIQSPQRHAEQEPHPGHNTVAIADARAGLGKIQLEPADVVGRRRVGGPLQKRGESLAAVNVAALGVRAELARGHVFDHALAQRADGVRTHRQLLSWMRFTTPLSSRQGTRPDSDDLSSGCRPRGRATRAAGYRAAI